MRPQTTFSIIMAVKNGEKTLARALDSLLAQTHAQWECLAQDGASTDATAGILDARAADGRIKPRREADSGVYQAWNRALDRACGDWLMFLGADDALAGPHVLARAARELAALPPAVLFAQAGLNLGRRGEVTETVARSKAEVFRFFVSGMPLLTPAVFFRRDLFAHGARFDESYRIAGDFAFVAERLRPDNLALLPFVASYMELGGLSSALKSRPVLDEERKRVLREIALPRAADIVQACIDTYGDVAPPLRPGARGATE